MIKKDTEKGREGKIERQTDRQRDRQTNREKTPHAKERDYRLLDI
jgi:hypothetical protein